MPDPATKADGSPRGRRGRKAASAWPRGGAARPSTPNDVSPKRGYRDRLLDPIPLT